MRLKVVGLAASKAQRRRRSSGQGAGTYFKVRAAVMSKVKCEAAQAAGTKSTTYVGFLYFIEILK